MPLLSTVLLSLSLHPACAAPVAVSPGGGWFRPLVQSSGERADASRPAKPAYVPPHAKAMRLVIMGAPGSGKGTHSKRIELDFGVKHISSGELLREYAKTDPEVAGYIARGELVPFPIVMRLMKRRLSESDIQASGFILDGFPRRLEDAIALEEMLAELNMPLDALVKLDVPEDELLRRVLGRGRADDTEAVFRERMRVYRGQTEPVFEFLRGKVPFLTPDVSGSDPDAAYENVRRALSQLHVYRQK